MPGTHITNTWGAQNATLMALWFIITGKDEYVFEPKVCTSHDIRPCNITMVVSLQNQIQFDQAWIIFIYILDEKTPRGLFCYDSLWDEGMDKWTTKHDSSVLSTIITWHFSFHPVNVNILHVKGEYGAQSESRFTASPHCYVMWCPLT